MLKIYVSLSDVDRIKSYVGDAVNASEIELGFEVMSALHKYLQHGENEGPPRISFPPSPLSVTSPL